MAHSVHCVKIGRELPGLDSPPVTGELGQRIYENVSAQAWDLWKEHRVILINHYGLMLYDPQAQEFLRQQLETFFFGDDAQLPDEWTPPTAAGKGGATKGAPTAQRK